MICVYYQINSSGEVEFFLHHFKNSLKENGFTLKYKGKEQQLKVEHHASYNKSLHYTNYTSIMPNNTKFIYHSLSPFDKIFYSIGQTLKENKYTTSHYIKSMNYIGTQSFFKDDVSHEIETISNLITLFTNDFGRKPFEESLRYKFSALKINFNILNNINIDNIDNYISTIEDTLSRYTNIDKYPLLIKFNNLKQDIKKMFFQTIIDFLLYEIKDGKDLLFYIFIHNIDFQKLFYVTNLNKFLELIDFSNIIYEDGGVNKELLKENIKKLDINKQNSTLFKDSSFFKNMLTNFEVLDSIIGLSNASLENTEELKNIKDLKNVVKIIRQLKNKDYLDFQIELEKDSEKVNYFYLSSGEKTMISYFANLLAAINKFETKNNNTFVIFIDEIELHLHPEWQRNFINYINGFFKSNTLNIKFQFIIATHSPFILSDIVEEQIIFLNQDTIKVNECNTFGANIYDIFEKGFFLDNSIGKCSEKYIQDLSNILYLFKALHHAIKFNDSFLLRHYLKYFYVVDKENEDLSIELKSKQDKDLINLIFDEIKKEEFSILSEKISISSLKYIILNDNSIILKGNEYIENSINIIGEPTIKTHLKELYKDLEGVTLDANITL